ncbi:hypothetical protein [Cytobacillus kochii]|uniref:hypothetical protein n=1 Tax=Cytobacillus kochii TaxID=859143 RepID=UPI00296FFDA7|nr:hypothetical protein [Cytobacillus kochii]
MRIIIYIFAVLLVIALLLFILSFFLKDPYRSLKDEIDQLSIQHVKETYQIKKKLKLLEEELLIDEIKLPNDTGLSRPKKKEVHEIIKNQVLLLHKQGLSTEQIAKQSSLLEDEVLAIITASQLKGEKV